MRNLGPRVVVKRDSESSIGRGCDLRGAHFRPEVSAIVHAACQAAHSKTPAVEELWLTEGLRDIRNTRDMHEELRALDITGRLKGGKRANKALLEKIAREMRRTLGPDYQIIVHGKGANLHIHAELDPR